MRVTHWRRNHASASVSEHDYNVALSAFIGKYQRVEYGIAALVTTYFNETEHRRQAIDDLESKLLAMFKSYIPELEALSSTEQ